jgi:alkylation response protein AidB-like acyl-CoA dehydrogenase
MMDVGQFRAELATWLDANADTLAAFRSNYAGTLEEAAEQGAEFIRALYDAGWNRWGWPEASGGLGGGAVHRAALYEQLFASGYRIPQRYYSLEILGPALQQFASHLAPIYLPRFLSGRNLWCQGFSEPDAGSDLGALRLRAVDEGDHWRVNGQKVWTSFAHLSACCCLLTRTGPEPSGYRGLTMLWVDMDSPGITARPLATMSGENELAEVFFDDVVVPKDHVLGEPGSGWTIAMYLLQWERGMYAWLQQAWMHARLEDLLVQADKDRLAEATAQFGRLYQMLFAVRVKSAETVRALDAGQSPGPEISADKVLLARAEQALFDLARELLSSEFVLDDEPEVLAWRDDYWYSRAASIYGGAIDIQRGIIAERLLGLPRGR